MVAVEETHSRERVHERVKALPGTKPCVLSGNAHPGVAEVGSLFPRLSTSIWESCRQKVRRTVARARFALQDVKKICQPRSTFWKMGSAKCAPDCSENSVCTLKC